MKNQAEILFNISFRYYTFVSLQYLQIIRITLTMPLQGTLFVSSAERRPTKVNNLFICRRPWLISPTELSNAAVCHLVKLSFFRKIN